MSSSSTGLASCPSSQPCGQASPADNNVMGWLVMHLLREYISNINNTRVQIILGSVLVLLVLVVISNSLRAAPARQYACNVYVTLADGAYCMHGCRA